MLSLADKDIKKTRLMHKTNLCYYLFIEYLDFLLEKEFLGVKPDNPKGQVYFTTEKGKKILKDIQNVLSQIE
jgi:predicted transcriptional regulator